MGQPSGSGQTPSKDSSAPVRYVLALLACLVAFALTWVFATYVQRLYFLFFYPTVALISAFLGFGPGAFATVLGAVASNYSIMGRAGHFDFEWHSLIVTGTFLLLGTLISWIGGSRRLALKRLAGSERELRRRHEELEEASRTLEQRVRQRTEELERSKEALNQAQRLESLGRLAGGVAHDFNNLMTAILGIAEDIKSRAADDSLRADIDDISQAAGKASQITKQLLAFGRQQISRPTLLSLNTQIQELVGLLKRLIGEDLALTVKCANNLYMTRIDPGQVEQIVMNLVLNARDAMRQGGTLRIETSNVTLTEHYAATHFDVKPGEYVLLAVSDTGVGMDGETLRHIFDPFFTTKGPGRGTGMGLASVHGIVKQNGGDIAVFSEPGVGTTFRVYLPAAASPGLTPGGRPVADGVEMIEAATILLVEDEELVRKVAFRALKRGGFRVIEAASGEEALAKAAQEKEQIDLVLTDVVMPGMDGRALADQIVKARPDIKILFMSGYARHIIADRGILKPGTNFIEKTFTGKELVTKVQDVLRKDPRPTSNLPSH